MNDGRFCLADRDLKLEQALTTDLNRSCQLGSSMEVRSNDLDSQEATLVNLISLSTIWRRLYYLMQSRRKDQSLKISRSFILKELMISIFLGKPTVSKFFVLCLYRAWAL